ncbi:hypothetical protein GCM10010238_50990 [Streptomyces griseoviridis]|uniref:Uncharacterized protein n=1 Tax=Streptomyces griseoviridis TaxID=45398 RepID=A0A918GQT5_STRGD|nr:hypothetical protein GCM10010238_50990 [Streptomyces niveoruber]
MSLQQLADLRFQGSALSVDGRERTGQGRGHEIEGAGARDDHGLLVERVEHLVDQSAGHAWSLGPDHLSRLAVSGFPRGGWGSVAFRQPGHGGVVRARAQDVFQAGVELGEQAACPVGGGWPRLRGPGRSRPARSVRR